MIDVIKTKRKTVSVVKSGLTAFLLVVSLVTMAGGKVSGVVTDSKTKETLLGATLIIEGSTQGAATDIEGNYIIDNIPAGKHNLIIQSMGYDKKIVAIQIVDGQMLVSNIELTETGFDLEGVVVVTQRRTDTDLSLLSSIKLSNSVVSGISSQQIGKTLDKDASEVVKRVPGITIQENRFVVVRGLNQRYNNVWLNNAATPSSETDVKAFSFDAVPSSMIDNLLVFKTGAPELSAEATGGFIKIVTKNIPDEPFFNVDYSAQYNEQTSFNDTYRLNGSSTDLLGFDNGARSFANSQNSSWYSKKYTALPNQKLGIHFGKKWKLKSGAQIGNLTSFNFGNTLSSRTNAQNYQYESFDATTLSPVFNTKYHSNIYSNEIKIGIMHNSSYIINASNRIEFKNLFNQIGVDKSSDVSGYNTYRHGDFQYFDNQYSSRATYSGQLSGTHSFWSRDDSKLDWVAGFSYANRKEPNGERWSKKLNTDNGNFEYVIPNISSINELGRLYLDNQEYVSTLAANFSHKFSPSPFSPTLKAGIYGEYKTRDFSTQSLCYRMNMATPFTDEQINAFSFDELFNQNILLQEDVTEVKDSYSAQNSLYAGYAALNIPIKKLTVYGGVRAEYNTLTLDGYTGSGDENSASPVHVENPELSLCPSVNLSYALSKKSLLRFAYAKTVNRPEFRELAPFSYYDFTERFSVVGDTTLQTASIQNFDLRYEFYPTPAETFTLALFYKNFTNPIEMVSIGDARYSFANAKGAENWGIEVDMKKSLAFIGLKNFSLTANASYIYSLVEFADKLNERDRPLQGQSPYVVNAGLFYQNDKAGFSSSLVYNVIGERIVVAAELNQGNVVIPDIYEMPRHAIDLVVNKKLGKKFELKFGVKDILAQDYVTQQTFEYTDGAGQSQSVVLKNKVYNLGRTWSLGASYKF